MVNLIDKDPDHVINMAIVMLDLVTVLLDQAQRVVTLLHSHDLIVNLWNGPIQLAIHKKIDVITRGSAEPCPVLVAHKTLLILAMRLIAEIATLDLLDALGVLDGARHCRRELGVGW